MFRILWDKSFISAGPTNFVIDVGEAFFAQRKSRSYLNIHIKDRIKMENLEDRVIIVLMYITSRRGRKTVGANRANASTAPISLAP